MSIMEGQMDTVGGVMSINGYCWWGHVNNGGSCQ